MRWQNLRRSRNVEDRRGGALPYALGSGAGLGVLAFLYFIVTGDLRALVPAQDPGPQSSGVEVDPAEAPLVEFVSAVLASTEDVWHALMAGSGQEYRAPKLVLFSDVSPSGCGSAQAAMGPFYCPLDEKVYIDLGFYRGLKENLGAPGDFAQAYVIAHEVGHHLQNLLKILEHADAAKRAVGTEAEANRIQVKVELQADCLAGVWAFHANKNNAVLESGDLEEALGAASAVGDDKLQQKSQGRIVPDSFTHGSSEERVDWFREGFEGGTVEGCNTFARDASPAGRGE